MLYTLNLHSAIYQLYRNKTARKKKEKVLKNQCIQKVKEWKEMSQENSNQKEQGLLYDLLREQKVRKGIIKDSFILQ